MDFFDVVVIGGGSAGYAAARTAESSGAKVAIVDKGPLGGLCILRGCMPTKAILRSSDILALMHRAKEFGLFASNLSADLALIHDRKTRLVNKFASYRIEQLQDPKFSLIEERIMLGRWIQKGQGLIVGGSPLGDAYLDPNIERPKNIQEKSELTKITNIPIIGVIGNSDKSNNLVVLDNPKSVISESFRSLRTNIQYLSSEIENKVVTITSSVGSEGKTFCTSNLALIMAAAGYKTILIGADLRKPKTHEVFNVDNSLGLSSYLINKSTLSEIVHKTDAEKLRVIPSGPIPPNPSELLNSDRMKKLIEELKKTYDYIILDTPPCGLVTDSVITMNMSDINLYIVRHNYTKENMLNIINDLHNSEQVKNINIIINDYIVSSSSYGY